MLGRKRKYVYFVCSIRRSIISKLQTGTRHAVHTHVRLDDYFTETKDKSRLKHSFESLPNFRSDLKCQRLRDTDNVITKRKDNYICDGIYTPSRVIRICSIKHQEIICFESKFTLSPPIDLRKAYCEKYQDSCLCFCRFKK